jgi:hypothetical protein
VKTQEEIQNKLNEVRLDAEDEENYRVLMKLRGWREALDWVLSEEEEAIKKRLKEVRK